MYSKRELLFEKRELLFEKLLDTGIFDTVLIKSKAAYRTRLSPLFLPIKDTKCSAWINHSTAEVKWLIDSRYWSENKTLTVSFHHRYCDIEEVLGYVPTEVAEKILFNLDLFI